MINFLSFLVILLTFWLSDAGHIYFWDSGTQTHYQDSKFYITQIYFVVSFENGLGESDLVRIVLPNDTSTIPSAITFTAQLKESYTNIVLVEQVGLAKISPVAPANPVSLDFVFGIRLTARKWYTVILYPEPLMQKTCVVFTKLVQMFTISDSDNPIIYDQNKALTQLFFPPDSSATFTLKIKGLIPGTF